MENINKEKHKKSRAPFSSQSFIIAGVVASAVLVTIITLLYMGNDRRLVGVWQSNCIEKTDKKDAGSQSAIYAYEFTGNTSSLHLAMYLGPSCNGLYMPVSFAKGGGYVTGGKVVLDPDNHAYEINWINDEGNVVLYSIYTIENDVLYFGEKDSANDGSSSIKRHKKLNLTERYTRREGPLISSQ